MSFSFGRALQSTVLTLWDGKEENYAPAQALLSEGLVNCANAQKGEYETGTGASEKTYQAGYVY